MKPASVSMRLAWKVDAKGFVDSWNESFRKGHLRYTATQLRSRQEVERFRKRYSESKRNEIVFVAVADKNKIIGNCGFFARERGRTRHRGELGWMVHHDYVGRGIATKLLGAVLKEAKRRGFKTGRG